MDRRLVVLTADPFDPLLQTHKLKSKLSGAWACSVDYDCRIVFNFVQNIESGELDHRFGKHGTDGTLIISPVSQHFGSFIFWITLKRSRKACGIATLRAQPKVEK